MIQGGVQRIALVGGGVIGGGWAARCLANGLEVVLTDPRAEARDYVEKTIADAWPVLEAAGLTDKGDRSRLYFADDIAAAVAQADFIQENVPEREALKIEIHEEISAHAKSDAIIASSSSGLLPSGHRSSFCPGVSAAIGRGGGW